jgi:hypothetical protein
MARKCTDASNFRRLSTDDFLPINVHLFIIIFDGSQNSDDFQYWPAHTSDSSIFSLISSPWPSTERFLNCKLCEKRAVSFFSTAKPHKWTGPLVILWQRRFLRLSANCLSVNLSPTILRTFFRKLSLHCLTSFYKIVTASYHFFTKLSMLLSTLYEIISRSYHFLQTCRCFWALFMILSLPLTTFYKLVHASEHFFGNYQCFLPLSTNLSPLLTTFCKRAGPSYYFYEFVAASCHFL